MDIGGNKQHLVNFPMKVLRKAKKIVEKSIDRESLHQNVASSKRVAISDEMAIFKYKRSLFVKRVTWLVFVIFIGISCYLYYSSSGSYLSAWFVSIFLSMSLLIILSFPRYIKVSKNSIEIHCILEVSVINMQDIRRVFKIKRYRLSRVIPILGSYGFGGFFGYYFDLRQLRILYFHATKLTELVVIENIYGDRCVVSCDSADQFCKVVKHFKKISNTVV